MTGLRVNAFLGLPDATIVLASASVARQNILRSAGINFDIIPPAVDEARVRTRALADDIMPADIAVLLALLKAQAVSQHLITSTLAKASAYVIGCDQILISEGQIINKPENINAAKEQLCSLAGKTHKLLSAIVLLCDGQRIWHHLAESSLTMH